MYGASGGSRTHTPEEHDFESCASANSATLANTYDKNGAEGRTRTGTVVTYRRILSPVCLPIPPPRLGSNSMEAAPGFEPGVKVLQTSALPLGYAALFDHSH